MQLTGDNGENGGLGLRLLKHFRAECCGHRNARTLPIVKMEGTLVASPPSRRAQGAKGGNHAIPKNR